MSELSLMKVVGGAFVPLACDTEAAERVRVGEVIRADFKRARNPKFHRKYFALIGMAFDHFEPKAVMYRGQSIVPAKNLDEFRKWVTVKAGYYDVVGYPDGSVRIRAKSISFAAMDDAEFEQLYSRTIDALLAHVLHMYQSREQVDAIVNEILRFD